MTSATDPRTKAAMDLLRDGLEEAFLQTSESCAFKLRGVDLELSDQVPDEETYDSDLDAALILQQSIQRWRDLSQERIDAGFKSLFAVARESKEPGVPPADIATKLTRTAVEQAFQWDRRGRTSRFIEWLKRCGVGDIAYMANEIWPPLGETRLNEALEIRLTRDFQAAFERLLTRLRNEALLSDKDAPPTPGPERPGDKKPTPYADPPDLQSQDTARRGKARAWVVERAIEELNYLRPLLERGQTPEELSAQYPDFLIFQEKRLRKFLITEPLAKQAYKKAALEVAAARIGLAGGTVENEWKRYRHHLPKTSRLF